MSKLIYGVGISDGPSSVGGVKCPYHQRWRDMLKRCYSESYHEDKPSYKDCFVCKEWLTFSNFKAWMVTQNWDGNVLDKDILFDGNKEYRPDRCVFVTNDVNQFISKGGKRNGLMIGVTWLPDKNRYLAQVGRARRSGYIGLFQTEIGAHNAYISKKAELAIELASLQTDKRIADALIKRYVKEKTLDC